MGGVTGAVHFRRVAQRWVFTRWRGSRPFPDSGKPCYGLNHMPTSTDDFRPSLRRLVDEYRDRCLWFLRADYYPDGDSEILRILGYIERHGDRRGYQRAAEIRRWLSRQSSATSAGC